MKSKQAGVTATTTRDTDERQYMQQRDKYQSKNLAQPKEIARAPKTYASPSSPTKGLPVIQASSLTGSCVTMISALTIPKRITATPGVAKREGRAGATRMGLEDAEVTGVLARTGVVGGMGGGKLGASDASRFGVGDAGSVLTDGVEKGEGAGRGVPKEGATSCARSRNEVPATGVGAGSEEEPNEIGATGTPGGHDSTEERPATKNLLGLPRQKRQENSSRMGGAQGHAASDPDIHCGVVPPARRVLPRSWASLRLRHPALAHPRSHQLSPPVPRGVLHGRQTHRVYQCRPPLDAHRRGIPRASLGRHPASIHVPAPPVVRTYLSLSAIAPLSIPLRARL
ncbi:hypothetical protein DFH09DRAFT_1096223 [Mycena vulgaris]|nr:hypothetical protein DFH09DRAFT_1096223 [Mycena vulgaris]